MISRDSSFSAIISAGGKAARMGGIGPKALLDCDKVPFLSYCLATVIASGLNRILVCVDDQRMLDKTRRICDLHGNITVEILPAVSSTFAIARSFAKDCDERFLFMYGHCPRRVDVLKQLEQSIAPVSACSVSISSAKRPYSSRTGRFLEPPFFVSRTLVESSKAGSWYEFFKDQVVPVEEHLIDGPGEFNNLGELESFRTYLRASFPHGLPTSSNAPS